ncbi:MAG: hypothetical protein GX030_09440 [Firmicutes bacterium]|nr:hypothetical protein [Bacillota bacterium]
MGAFPRTVVGGLSVSRLIIGTNWFLGWSHQTPAKDAFIKENVANRRAMADILEVFLKEGVDTIMGPLTQHPIALEAIKEAEDRTGVHMIKVDTPIINIQDTDEARDETRRLLDEVAATGAEICLPHHSSVEQLVDKSIRKIRRIDDYTKMIRERGMIPGLSAHMPEIVVYSDENDYDVETYIQIYNSMGFLMQLEVDWIARIIHNAKKPVMTIKPMAAGRISPFAAFPFVWNTIRDIDMVTVGTMTPREAAEVIEYSLAALERRPPQTEIRGTPSKDKVTD